ncbi:helveticin J family class III bacteriocin [Lactobacillus sp. ESL0679]|uniref:helveticin J family class III bacteriocin n=1 Tax=Lactobacillus sp. ESL0679 TaxID=2983209 RepID=UPI0023F93C8E|nr:helveticin J family class III bacteriocin [Lactobacillus sp. ESL0679]MDF7683837.1 helveticin J family class III bacteriocin [Lactobacillus sp. ESL0679]
MNERKTGEILLTETKNATGGYKLTPYYHNVIQKGDVASSYIYALQMHSSESKTLVTRRSISSGSIGLNPMLLMTGTAGGHTQTWEYAGNGYWFIGTKPQSDGSHNWDIQIARVKYPSSGTRQYTSNTQLTRLSHINRAGWDHNNDYDGDYLHRVEAAVSPNYDELLIASIDTDGNGYFTRYDLNMINNELDNNPGDDVSLWNLSSIDSFKIPNLTDSSVIGSIQGYDIDENNNIIISSEYSKDYSGTERKIYIIPWGATSKSQWTYVDLSTNGQNASYAQNNIDISGYYTEFESVQVIGINDVYLTISYHNSTSGTTEFSRIIEVTWN